MLDSGLFCSWAVALTADNLYGLFSHLLRYVVRGSLRSPFVSGYDFLWSKAEPIERNK
jgi:hypothetical protein